MKILGVSLSYGPIAESPYVPLLANEMEPVPLPYAKRRTQCPSPGLKLGSQGGVNVGL